MSKVVLIRNLIKYLCRVKLILPEPKKENLEQSLGHDSLADYLILNKIAICVHVIYRRSKFLLH